jgi:hypothetical protein
MNTTLPLHTNNLRFLPGDVIIIGEYSVWLDEFIFDQGAKFYYSIAPESKLLVISSLNKTANECEKLFVCDLSTKIFGWIHYFYSICDNWTVL